MRKLRIVSDSSSDLLTLDYADFAFSPMKRQEVSTLKDVLPRLVCVQYAAGEEQRNSSRRNEKAEPKQKQHSIVEMTGDENKVQCY